MRKSIETASGQLALASYGSQGWTEECPLPEEGRLGGAAAKAGALDYGRKSQRAQINYGR
jgi:hypothetical protein